MARWLWPTLAILTAAALGCPGPTPPRPGHGDGEPSHSGPTHLVPPTAPGASPQVPVPVVTATDEAGIISGVVRWEGPVDSDGTEELAGLTVGSGGGQIAVNPVRRLQVDPEGRGVADVVVWLVNPPGGAAQAPAGPVTLTQREGDYRPHVLLAPKAARLELTSADDTAVFRAEGAAEFVETVSPGRPALHNLGRAGLVVVRSDILPWASAYVHVFDHGHYARTGADGTFRLPPVSAGTYHVVLWHEGWRFTDKARYTAPPLRAEVSPVTVEPGKGASVAWTLSGK
jgi:hypothetical protein